MTDDEQPPAATASRRRSRGSDATTTARSEALERLKASRSGGRRRSEAPTSQIKMEKPIYDTMEEDEYDALVAKRKEAHRGFIEDDNGLGYLDEGEEEDWTKGGVSLTSDESEGEAEEKKKKKKVEKKDGQRQQRRKQAAALTDAAAMAGTQKISPMFTSSVFKKSKDDKLNGSGVDSVLEDVLAEIEPTEEDRQRRRRKQNGAILQGKPATPSSTGGAIVARKPDPIEFVINNDYDMKLAQESDPIEENGTAVICQDANDSSGETNGSEVVERSVEIYSEIKVEQYSLNAKIKDEKDPALSATAGWHAARSAGVQTIYDSDV